MSCHVVVRLPDGRDACADYRQPIVWIMRRVLVRINVPPTNPDRQTGGPDDLADKALIAEWLDCCPELACEVGCDDDNGKHPPATREPFTPPPYRRPAERK
jgi:hypothetical protein